jgi:hypothetical protein
MEYPQDIQPLLTKRWTTVNADDKSLQAVWNYCYQRRGAAGCCCPAVVEQFFKDIKAESQRSKSINMKTKSKYILKESAVVWLPHRHLNVTNANLTDQLAEEIIGMGKRGFFRHIPEVEAIVETPKPTKKKR